MARKLAILSRFSLTRAAASGRSPDLANGWGSITTQSLVPGELSDIQSPEAFVAALADHDDHFDRLRAKAQAAGKVLRYVGALDRGQGTVECGLRECVVTVLD